MYITLNLFVIVINLSLFAAQEGMQPVANTIITTTTPKPTTAAPSRIRSTCL